MTFQTISLVLKRENEWYNQVASIKHRYHLKLLLLASHMLKIMTETYVVLTDDKNRFHQGLSGLLKTTFDRENCKCFKI